MPVRMDTEEDASGPSPAALEPSLFELAQRHQDGDPVALRAFMVAVHPHVSRIVFRLAGAGPEFEDLVQSCLEQLCRALAGFAGRSRITTFVFAVCHRVIWRQRRSERLRRLFRLRTHESVLLPQEAPGPEASLERRQLLQEAAEVLSRLSFQERSVFVLHELEELPLGDVAQALGCSTRTVKRRLRSARSGFLGVAS
jgi:RNA polymerase sigma-70 factor (ECF subfamily)